MNDTHDGSEDPHLESAMMAHAAFDVDAGEYIWAMPLLHGMKRLVIYATGYYSLLYVVLLML